MLIGGVSVGRTSTNNCEVLRNLPEASISGTTITPLDNCNRPTIGRRDAVRLWGRIIHCRATLVSAAPTRTSVGSPPRPATSSNSARRLQDRWAAPCRAAATPDAHDRSDSSIPLSARKRAPRSIPRQPQFSINPGAGRTAVQHLQPRQMPTTLVSAADAVGSSWQNVTGLLPPRMMKLGVQIDF